MKKIIILASFFIIIFSINVFGQKKEKKILYFVVPIEKNVKDTKFYPLLEQTGKEKILYYVEYLYTNPYPC